MRGTDYLLCDHCGGCALEYEGAETKDPSDAKCMECGFPGHLEKGDAEGVGFLFHWVPSDLPWAKCEDKDCTSCFPEMSLHPSDPPGVGHGE